VGYRYPHAYAEHWVAQQYLPNALQGQVFWQPGRLGWEGALRPRLEQRRAAQLAAAAETAADQVEVLSHGPEDPQLQRWLARSAAAEGERLDQLRHRFWQDTSWRRHERVLIVGARSLLWALDALEHTPEGQVVISTDSPDDLQRLQAQLKVLDQLRQPTLLLGLEAAEGPFERIAGRQLQLGGGAAARRRWLARITALAAPGCELRLLRSQSLLGPVSGLLQLLPQQPEHPELQRLAAAEVDWLAAQTTDLTDELQRSPWQVSSHSWDEPLQLELQPPMLQRWFGSDQSYGRFLQDQLGDAAQLQALETLFRQVLNSSLPQRLRHQLLIARLQANPAAGAAD
jgi:putative ATPase